MGYNNYENGEMSCEIKCFIQQVTAYRQGEFKSDITAQNH